jgi:hypothetical protein
VATLETNLQQIAKAFIYPEVGQQQEPYRRKANHVLPPGKNLPEAQLRECYSHYFLNRRCHDTQEERGKYHVNHEAGQLAQAEAGHLHQAFGPAAPGHVVEERALRLDAVGGRLAGKQIGGVEGRKLNVKKAKEAKEKILKNSVSFNGSLNDDDCKKLVGVARNTFYKYKRELRVERAK